MGSSLSPQESGPFDEVNFWQPSGDRGFAAIRAGELFLFKLKSPRNAIGGFGVFFHAYNVPISLAWEAFGAKNGAPSLPEMRRRVSRYRKDSGPLDYTIGCRIVVQPVFLPRELWVPQPESWSPQTVTGRRFDTVEAEGRALWDAVMSAAEAAGAPALAPGVAERQAPFIREDLPRFGAPALVQPRLGQGAFRVAVTDAYGRECALSGGRVLPALDAAHIRAYAEGGAHDVSNGLLLRRDIHSVFDAGYATFDDDLRFVVSDRVRTEFNNGNEYRRLHGARLKLPNDPRLSPDKAALAWHRENRFAA